MTRHTHTQLSTVKSVKLKQEQPTVTVTVLLSSETSDIARRQQTNVDNQVTTIHFCIQLEITRT